MRYATPMLIMLVADDSYSRIDSYTRVVVRIADREIVELYPNTPISEDALSYAEDVVVAAMRDAIVKQAHIQGVRVDDV